MKNVYIKILLLLLAIIIAVGGVMYFVKTIVEPPVDSNTIEVNNADLTAFIEKYKPSSANIKIAEDSLDIGIDRVNLYLSDELISMDKRDEHIQSLLSKFVPQFKNWAYSKFNGSVWNSSDHREMQRVIRKLRSYTVENGDKVALNSEQNSTLSGIENVISDYNAAWVASRSTGFTNAQSNISTANSYKNKPYIKNCTTLVQALNDVPRKIMVNHYNHVLNRVNSLSSPSAFSNRDSFNSAASNIYSEIESFKNASYGVDKGDRVSTLMQMHDRYKIAARNYTWPNEITN